MDLSLVFCLAMVAAAVILKFISIIAMVLGLALQSTLGDVFSGLSLSIEKPYSIGDEIALEGGASNDGLGRSGESLVIGRIGSGHRCSAVSSLFGGKAVWTWQLEVMVSSGPLLLGIILAGSYIANLRCPTMKDTCTHKT